MGFMAGLPYLPISLKAIASIQESAMLIARSEGVDDYNVLLNQLAAVLLIGESLAG